METDPPLVIRNWRKWQSMGINAIQRKRAFNGTDPHKPYSLQYVSVASVLDDRSGNFQAFAALVGRYADCYLFRVLQYAAIHSWLDGHIHVARGPFSCVLSRGHDSVSRTTAGRVYDALLASGICVLGRAKDVPNGLNGASQVPSQVRIGQRQRQNKRKRPSSGMTVEEQRRIAEGWAKDEKRGGTSSSDAIIRDLGNGQQNDELNGGFQEERSDE